ncbi:MAG: hypothetical protein JNL70_21915 [Saprospiraceae bacterium]|nr:hypothetical protein [Saprospiraceae bacterium]
MNRLLFSILCTSLWLVGCQKEDNSGTTTPCVQQTTLPDSIGKWRLDTFDLPKNERYNKDIFFVSDSTGFLLKDYYALFKTANGGKTWTQLQGFSNNEIAEESYFINEKVGFVSVFGRPTARLLTTTDGGTTWENRIYNLNGTFNNIHFFDDKRGIALISALYGSALITNIYQTTDQAKTWTPVRLPDSLSHKKALQFVNAQTGFCVINSNNADFLIKTTDGGSNWRGIGNLPQVFTQMKFMDEQNGIATTTTQVYMTNDGGLTWTARTDITGYPNVLFAKSPTDLLAAVSTIQCDFKDYATYQGQLMSMENGIWQKAKNVTNLEVNYPFFVNTNLGFGVWKDKLLRFKR